MFALCNDVFSPSPLNEPALTGFRFTFNWLHFRENKMHQILHLVTFALLHFSPAASVWSLAGCFYCRMNCCRVAFTELAPYLVAATYNVFGGKNNGTPCEKKTMKMISPGFPRLAFCISRTLSHTHLPKHTHSLTRTCIQVHTRTLSLALAPFFITFCFEILILRNLCPPRFL